MIRYAGPGMGVVWLVIPLVLIVLLLVVIAVRLFIVQPGRPPKFPPGAGPRGPVPPEAGYAGVVPPQPGHTPGTAGPSGGPWRTREILDERLARGEITPEQYRELRQTLEG